MKYHWQKKRERISHADDWLMTYADMITLLLCFFAVFLTVSMPKKEIPPVVEPPPPAQIAQAETIPPAPDISQTTEVVREAKVQFEIPVDETLPPPETSVIEDKIIEQKDQTPPVEAKTETPPAPPPEIANNPKAQNAAEFEKKGDRITTLEMDSAAFFDSGSAVISDNGKVILKDVAKKIQSDEFKDYQVTVEGHTDDAPIKTPLFPSNWELSTARASAVVHYFLEAGIPAQKLRAAGYADTFPKAPNHDASGNAIAGNQAQNRRVVIKLERIERGKL